MSEKHTFFRQQKKQEIAFKRYISRFKFVHQMHDFQISRRWEIRRQSNGKGVAR